MAQWKETLEPYIKVYERIRTTALVPTAGEDLIVGATIVSDSGPATPTLITSQKEFLDVFSSQDLTESYIKSLDKFYEDGTDSVASTMWLNAYRLAGSVNMLVVRATKGADISYVKPITGGTTNTEYIIRDGQLLKKVPEFKLVADIPTDQSTHTETGWAISVNEVGTIGNLTTDQGPAYDYYARNLYELVEYLNGTSKFFSPNYEFYSTVKAEDGSKIVEEDFMDNAVCVYFKEVYMASHFIDPDGFRIEPFFNTSTNTWNSTHGGTLPPSTNDTLGTKADGLAYLIAVKPTAESLNLSGADVLDLNGTSYSGGTFESNCYATNVYNSNTDLKVRIRRFNHDACVSLNNTPELTSTGYSSYKPLLPIIKIYNATLSSSSTATAAAKQAILDRDFFEIVVLDPSIDKDPISFNLGNIPGRGDMTIEEINDSLKMINLHVTFEELQSMMSYYGSADSTKTKLNSSKITFTPHASTVGAPNDKIKVIWSDTNSSIKGFIYNINSDYQPNGAVHEVDNHGEITISASELENFKSSGAQIKVIAVPEDTDTEHSNSDVVFATFTWEGTGRPGGWTLGTTNNSGGGNTGRTVSVVYEPSTGNEQGIVFPIPGYRPGTELRPGGSWEEKDLPGTSLPIGNRSIGSNGQFPDLPSGYTTDNEVTEEDEDLESAISELDENEYDLQFRVKESETVTKYYGRALGGGYELLENAPSSLEATVYVNLSATEDFATNGTLPHDFWADYASEVDNARTIAVVSTPQVYGRYLASVPEETVSSSSTGNSGRNDDGLDPYTPGGGIGNISKTVLRAGNGGTTLPETIYLKLGIEIEGENASSILKVSKNDLLKSISSITEDEIYTVEGITDLGNTDLMFQTYLCNMAKNENYFYPISTLNSTNYLAIANYRTKLAQDSHKLYTSAPWDIDSGTVGFRFYASPSVLYWEAVGRNRSMDREFASVFGFNTTGQVLYTNPVTEFTKKQRQLLLSKQVNTVMWNTQSQTWNMNDCYTMTSENHILNEDGNSRLFIRINKAVPTLLRPLIGRKLNDATYMDAETILKMWFKRTILPMQYTVSDYRITVAGLDANDDVARRQNKMYVLVECLFPRSLKYVIVYSDALDMGMEFTGEI